MSEKNIHAGHRQRMLKKYRDHSIDCLEEHEILEILLFLVFSRCNTNNISHMLIEKFGSINGVLSANRSELLGIDHIGESAATFLCFIGDFFRWLPAHRVKNIQLNTPQKIIEYCEPVFANTTKEMTYVLMLDARQNLVSQMLLVLGCSDSVTVRKMDIIRNAFIANSTNVVIVHNHITGSPAPSVADINATRELYNALRATGITLVDHIIIGLDSEEKGYSMRRSEILRDIWS